MHPFLSQTPTKPTPPCPHSLHVTVLNPKGSVPTPRLRRRHRHTTPLARASSLSTSPPTSTPAELEALAEQELRNASSADTIYGIPRSEWLQLNGPARYLGNEFGSIHKPWNDAEIRFALTYPEVYEVGASNLGHIILYGLLNKEDGLLCDRAYYPAADMQALLEKYNKRLFGVEHRRSLSDFDVLGFSLSYELGGTNILDMLHTAGIPLTWEERNAVDGGDAPFDPFSHNSPPLVFAGGPTATSNPEPFSAFFDFFALGDGEELLVEIGGCLKQCRRERLTRRETLYRLATTVVGVYVPQFYDTVRVPTSDSDSDNNNKVAGDQNTKTKTVVGFGGAVFPIVEGVPARVKRRVATPDPFQQIGLVPYVDTVHNRFTVEIRRGCTKGCRFCQPGMLTRPARDVAPERVVEAVEYGMNVTGYNEFSLLSLSCSDYLSLPSVGIEIKNRLRDRNVSLSLPSQRIDLFDDNIANIITNSGKRSGLTFAPEAGTQRLRDIINKGLTNEDLLRGVKTAWDRGWRQVKLYFMIGLPGETDADVLGIAETIEWLQRECRDGRWHLAVNVTISNFSPKPHTPFQWHSVSTSEFRRKQAMLKEAFKKLYQVKANFTPVIISAMEDFVARGDRRVSDVIRRAWELGATNDAWWQSEESAHAAWSQAIDDVGMTWKYRQVEGGDWHGEFNVLEKQGDERYRGQGAGGKGRIDRGTLADPRLDAPLPWDHVDTGISTWWLKTDLQRALEAATVPDCSHSGICTECGVCGDDEFGENVVYEPPPIPEFNGHYRPDATKAQRLRFRFSKSGDMVFIGHLDLMTTWDRAVRRAALPISTDQSPFAVRSRLFAPLPLPLGATASEEILEMFLTERSTRPEEEVMEKLQRQLPPGLRLVSVEEAEVMRIDGSNGEKVSQLLEWVEWEVGVGGGSEEEGRKLEERVRWGVKAVLEAKELPIKREGKGKQKGKKKGKVVDMRPALLSAEVVAGGSSSSPPEGSTPSVMIRYRSGCESGNATLSPSVLIQIINETQGFSTDGTKLSVGRLHRSRVVLKPPTPCEPDWLKLRSLLRQDGHVAAQKEFSKSGPWAGGLENRTDPLY